MTQTLTTGRPTFESTVADNVAQIVFDGGHPSNAMAIARMAELRFVITELRERDDVHAIVLYGGDDRSFCVGGDFNEVSHFSGGPEVDHWIDEISDLYVQLLELPVPVIAAIDGYAIGLGLQIALTADYRVGSSECELRMPEFQLGIACNFGGFMLERTVSRAVMQHMLMSCGSWSARRALRDGLLHEVLPRDELLAGARSRAMALASYNRAAVQSTKPFINQDFALGIRRIQRDAKRSHRAGFAAGRAQQNMRTILKK